MIFASFLFPKRASDGPSCRYKREKKAQRYSWNLKPGPANSCIVLRCCWRVGYWNWNRDDLGNPLQEKKRKSFRCNLFSFFASKVHSIQREEEERLLWNNPIKRRKKKKGKHQKERKRINFLCACLQGKIQSSLTMPSLLLTEEEVDSQTWKEKELKRRRAFMSEGNGCKNQRGKLEAQKTLGRTKLTDVRN